MTDWGAIAAEFGWGNVDAFQESAGIRRMAEEILRLREELDMVSLDAEHLLAKQICKLAAADKWRAKVRLMCVQEGGKYVYKWEASK